MQGKRPTSEEPLWLELLRAPRFATRTVLLFIPGLDPAVLVLIALFDAASELAVAKRKRHNRSSEGDELMPKTTEQIHTYSIDPDRDGNYRWTLYGPNGAITTASPVGFASESTAEKALEQEARERGIEVHRHA